MSKNQLVTARREFLQAVPVAAGAALLAGAGLPQALWAQEESPSAASAGGPADPSWDIMMVSPQEPGEPMVVTGTIYAPDGKTPVDGARLYVYHTDATGIYASSGRIPRLRGWMKTGPDGRYRFRSIRPASYPNQRFAAHIHSTLAAPGHRQRWIPEFLFAGDPKLQTAEIARHSRGGRFAAIQQAVRDAGGVWRYERDLRLER